MRLMRMFFASALIAATTSASAWWGGPWGGNNWGNRYNNGYGSGYGGMGGEQYRGGDAAGGGDFSMNLSGRGNTNMRGYGSGYGAGDTWGRSYNYSSPYYGGYAPYGYISPPPGFGYPPRMAMPQSGGDMETRYGNSGYGAGRYGVSQPDAGGVATSAASQASAGGAQGDVLTTAGGMTLYTYLPGQRWCFELLRAVRRQLAAGDDVGFDDARRGHVSDRASRRDKAARTQRKAPVSLGRGQEAGRQDR